MKYIEIINGPNLNLLGTREPEIYGHLSFDAYFKQLQQNYTNIATLTYFQSNHEGAIIDRLHQIGFTLDGIVINPAAYTHYSYAIADALKAIKTPVVEVHISDIHNREAFRKKSVTKEHCIQQISGNGLLGYQQAIELLINL